MVEIDTSEVKKTGNEYFPDLAAVFRAARYVLNSGQDDYAATGFQGIDFLPEWAMYNAQIGLMLNGSANNLLDCGDALVEVANDHDWTDEDNKHRFEKATGGSLEEAVEDREEERDRGMP